MYNFIKDISLKYLLPLIFFLVLASRFLYLDFGIPQVLQADEVEMAEYSLKYAVNLKKFFEGDLYFFKPFSFVYGTLPAYMNTLFLVPFLKITSYFNLSQDRYFIYLYLRVIYALFSVLTCLGVYFLAKQITKNKIISYFSAILFSLNFYFLWISKYLNNDILITLFLIYFLIYYLKFSESLKSKHLYVSMLFLGFGVATKITFLLVFIYPFIDLTLKRYFKKLSISVLVIFFIYLITNPFTFIFPIDFINRILEMRYKENGIVIDSYNTNYLKYLVSLLDNLSIPVVVFGLLKILKDIKEKKFDITSAIILIFIGFFSLSNRLVPRWVVPVYPLLIINFFIMTFYLKYKYVKEALIVLVLIFSLNQFVQANIELSQGSNMQKAFLDFSANYFDNGKKIYVITERGLNPFESLSRKGMSYNQASVILYESEGAFKSLPDNPENYDYVVFSSKVRNYYLNPYIFEINKEYSANWEKLFEKLINQEKFEVLGFYGSSQKSLLDQENIIIFKKKASN